MTVGEYVRLVQLQKEIDGDEPKDIKVTWVEPGETELPRNSLQSAAVPEDVSQIDGAHQRLFRTDRIGKEPGAVP